MVVVEISHRNTHGEEGIEVDNTYQGEEEGMEGDEDNENDPPQKKEKHTPLWKHFIRLGGGKEGGNTKFICHHCHTEYTGYYTRVRKHLCGTMYLDEGKIIGVKTSVKVEPEDRLKYQREEEVAQNKSKKPKVEPQSAQRMFIGQSASPHASAFLPLTSRRRTILDFLEQGCRDDVDAKNFRFLYACVIPFNVLRSPYWHEMVQTINGSLKDIGAPSMTKLEPWDLTGKEPKSKVL